MRALARDGALAYVRIDAPADIDRLLVRSAETDPDGFEFFRGLGIVGYAQAFKSWLGHFSRPVLLAAIRDREVVAWVFLEEYGGPAPDGSPVHVLRAIETLPELRGRRIGYRLLLLALTQSTGYLLTKPLTPRARRFFLRAGFSDLADISRPPVEPRRFPGYVVLPPERRRQSLARLADYLPSGDGAGGGSPRGSPPEAQSGRS